MLSIRPRPAVHLILTPLGLRRLKHQISHRLKELEARMTHDEFKARYMTAPRRRNRMAARNAKFTRNVPQDKGGILGPFREQVPQRMQRSSDPDDWTYDTIEDSRSVRDAKAGLTTMDKLLPGPGLYRTKQRAERRAPGTGLALVPSEPDLWAAMDEICRIALQHAPSCHCLLCRAARGSDERAIQQALLVIGRPDAMHYESLNWTKP
jgi:hypothetical protein